MFDTNVFRYVPIADSAGFSSVIKFSKSHCRNVTASRHTNVLKRCYLNICEPSSFYRTTLEPCFTKKDATISARFGHNFTKAKNMQFGNWRLPMLALDKPSNVKPGMMGFNHHINVVRGTHSLHCHIGCGIQSNGSEQCCSLLLVFVPILDHCIAGSYRSPILPVDRLALNSPKIRFTCFARNLHA